MKKRYKIALGIITFLLVVTTTIGSSYSVWTLNNEQTTTNTFAVTSCFELDLNETSSSINLRNAYPISDERGALTSPYTFTIRNTCNVNIPFVLTLNTLDSSVQFPTLEKLNDQYVRLSLTGDNNISASTLNTLPTTTSPLTVQNIHTSYVLASGVINANTSSNTYSLRLWLSENADGSIVNADGSITYGTNAMNKAFEANVTVLASTGAVN